MGKGDKSAEKKAKKRSPRVTVSPGRTTKQSPLVPSVPLEEVPRVADDNKSPRIVRLLNSISSVSPGRSRLGRDGSPRSPKSPSSRVDNSPRQEAREDMQRAFSTGVVASAGISPPSEPAPAVPPPDAEAHESNVAFLDQQLNLEPKSAGELLMEKYMAIEPPAVDFASRNVAFVGDDPSVPRASISATRSKSVPVTDEDTSQKSKLKRVASHERELSSGPERKDMPAAVVTEVDVAFVHLPEFEYDYDTCYEGSRLQRSIQIAEAKIVAALMNSQPVERTETAVLGEGERPSQSGSPSAGRLVEELSEKARILEHQCRTLEHKWQEGEAQLAENKKVLVSVKNQLHMHKEALAIARTKAQEGATTVDMLKGELKKAVTAIRAQQEKLRQYEQRQAASSAQAAASGNSPVSP